MRARAAGTERAAVAAATLALVLAAAPGAAATEIPDGWLHGANLTSYDSGGPASEAAVESIEALDAAGANAAAIVIPWYTPDRHSDELRADPNRTPTDRGIRTAIGRLHERGFRVVLKPQIEVEDGSFRGTIEPADPAEWFARYRTMIEHYAALAEETGVETLVVGVELAGVSSDPEFRTVIDAARARFDGELTYAANWDEVLDVPFWGDLDQIGVDGYFSLAGKPDESVDALVAAWRPTLAGLAGLSRAVGRPVLFTELGYARRRDAAIQPWAPTGPADHSAQARAYEAALRALSRERWVSGVLWWDWPLDASASPSEFSPRGAEAETVLRRWNGRPPVDTTIARSGVGGADGLAALGLLITVLFALALVRAAGKADTARDDDPNDALDGPAPPTPVRRRVIADGEDTLRQTLELALRVRRALPRWPMRELGLDQRAALAEALHEARSFDDLDPAWQELILEAEAGGRSPRVTRTAL